MREWEHVTLWELHPWLSISGDNVSYAQDITFVSKYCWNEKNTNKQWITKTRPKCFWGSSHEPFIGYITSSVSADWRWLKEFHWVSVVVCLNSTHLCWADKHKGPVCRHTLTPPEKTPRRHRSAVWALLYAKLGYILLLASGSLDLNYW